jgi:hypothetical protein
MASERILVTTQTLASCLASVKPVVAKRSVTDTPEDLLVASCGWHAATTKRQSSNWRTAWIDAFPPRLQRQGEEQARNVSANSRAIVTP